MKLNELTERARDMLAFINSNPQVAATYPTLEGMGDVLRETIWRVHDFQSLLSSVEIVEIKMKNILKDGGTGQ